MAGSMFMSTFGRTLDFLSIFDFMSIVADRLRLAYPEGRSIRGETIP
jgi:hypothetical protein